MVRLSLIFFALVLIAPCAFSASDATAQLGPHLPVLRLEKSENPQNIMVAYTRVDDECRFARRADDAPVFDFYWLMDRARYKRVHGLIKRGIEKRIEVSAQPSGAFTVRIKNFTEIEHDLEDPKLHVSVRREGSGCRIEPLLKLGPSDGNRTLLVRSLHSESRTTFLPPFRKIKTLTIVGDVVGTGERLSRTFRGKS